MDFNIDLLAYPQLKQTYFKIVERLLLQTIYVLNKEILQFASLKSAVYNRERIIMARVRYTANGAVELQCYKHIVPKSESVSSH